MLSKSGCEARRRQLWNTVPAEVNWLLVADPRHVNYLSGFLVNPFSFSGGERGLLLLERNAGTTLLADNFAFRSAAGPAYVDETVTEKWYDHKHSVINRDHALFETVKSIAPRLAGKTGLIEAEWLPAQVWPLLNAATISSETDLGTVLRGLRRQKHPDEVELLRQAMRATEAGHARAREVVRPGISEWDVYHAVQSAVLASLERPAIVYGDFRATNAEHPKQGGLPTGYLLQPGDLFILDYSVVVDGYRSDFTNTLAVAEPTAEQQRIFDTCLLGMQAGEATLKAGVSAKQVFRNVCNALDEQTGQPDSLTHHAGHGIGLAHPEPPILVPDSTDTLVAGDVVTLEPGLYVDGVGGVRIEHNYLITETGFERLSQHTIALRPD